MTYDVYKQQWLSCHPLANSLWNKNIDQMIDEFGDEHIIKIQYLYYCLDKGINPSISECEFDILFLEIIDIYQKEIFTKVFDYDDLLSMMELGVRVFHFSKEKREQVDSKVISVFKKYLLAEILEYTDFIYKYHRLIEWFLFHSEFCKEFEIGFSIVEYKMVEAFYYRNLQYFTKLKNENFKLLIDFGNYMFWLYDNYQSLQFDWNNRSKIFAEEILRLLLASSRINAYDQYECIIQEKLRVLSKNQYLSQKPTIPTVFISYSHEEKDLCDKICLKIENDFEIVRDVEKLKTGQDIPNFMKNIRNTDFVIIIISDAYLKSHNCMYEAAQWWKDFLNGILDRTVIYVHKSASPYKIDNVVKYIQYWQDKYTYLENTASHISINTNFELHRKINEVREIASIVGDFLVAIGEHLNTDEAEIEEYLEKLRENFQKINCSD